jgi:hypothetical protein
MNNIYSTWLTQGNTLKKSIVLLNFYKKQEKYCIVKSIVIKILNFYEYIYYLLLFLNNQLF